LIAVVSGPIPESDIDLFQVSDAITPFGLFFGAKSAGNNKAINIATMQMSNTNSIKVNPEAWRLVRRAFMVP
jgi:hypothetical protein